jgi:outer membrane protein assembly factor BamA
MTPRRESRIVVALLAWLGCCGAVSSQEGAAPGEAPDKKGLDLQLALGDDMVLSPIVGPMYTPEMDFALALGGLLTFSTDKSDATLPRSTVSAFVIYSTNSSFTLSSFGDTFWKQDRLRFDFAQWYKDMPDNYWGVGYDHAVDVPEGSETTAYNRVWFEFTPELTWRAAGDLFVGVNANLNRTRARDVAPLMAQDPDYLRDGDDVTGSGIGLTLRYDSRDVTVNAYRGRLFKATTTHFRDALGSDDDYDVYTVDFRQYHALGRPGRTVAWQLYGRFASGEVPWSAKSGVGSPFDLRGYTWGRFRDDVATWGLIEYRHMFAQRLPRHGWAAWVGLGFIGEDLGDLGGHDLPNAGLGWRWELQPRRNLRMDLGVGRDDAGFYLSMNEAF